MAKRCSICVSPKLTRVDQMILRGETLAEISRKHGFSQDSVGRHRRHMRLAMKSAADLQAGYGASLLDQIQHVKAEVEALANEAAHRRDTSGALKALREQLRILELEARLSGQLETGNRTQVNVQINQDRADKLVDEGTQIRIAQDYLSRHAPHLLAPAVQEVRA